MRRLNTKIAKDILASLIFSFIALLVLVSCGKKGFNGRLLGGDTHSDPVRVSFDQSVSSQEQEIILHDLEALSRLDFPELPTNREENRRIVGISEISGRSLNEWLRERMKFVVGENYDYTASTFIQDSNVFYSPNLFAAESSGIIMANLGAILYNTGKERSFHLYTELANQTVKITSARVGIFQIYDGLLGSPVAPGPLTSVANTLWRISTYLHEARHDDGNGASLTFKHVECNGEYEGSFGCDNFTNGPYEIEKVFLRNVIASCSQCSSNDINRLNIALGDIIARLNRGATHGDVRYERINF